MRQLNLDQIKTLIEVIERGSFTGAANELNLTQPAVSLQIQELESRFKVKLVERIGRGARPTPAGRELASMGRKLLDLAEDAHRVMRRYSDGFLGQVRIGMSMTLLIYVMPRVIRELKTSSPSLDLVIRTNFSGLTMHALMENDLDIGLYFGEVSDKHLEVVPLGEEQAVAIFPTEGKDIPEPVTPAFMGQWPLVLGNPRTALRPQVDAWIAQSGNSARPIMELDSVVGIKRVVGAGIGASIIPGSAIQEVDRTERLLVRHLHPPIKRPLMLIQRKDKIDDPAIATVRKSLVANVKLSA